MANSKDKRKRFNFVDVLLLIIIIAIIGTLAFIAVNAYNNFFMKDSTGTKIRYEIQVSELNEEVKYVIEKGDTVTETDTLSDIGRVVSIHETTSKYIGVDSEGAPVISDYPGKKDIALVVETNGVGSKGTYDVGAYVISVGKTINFRVPGFIGSGECVSVEVIVGE